MFLYLPRDVIRSTARFRLRVRTLRQSNSPIHLCDIQDEQHVLFHCANPHMISLHRKYEPLFPPKAAHDVFTFLDLEPEQ